MFLIDFLDKLSKEKRERDRVNAMKRFAVGMGIVATVGVAAGILFAPKSGKETRDDLTNKTMDTIDTIKGTVQKKAETVRDSATYAVQEVCHVIKNIHEKTEGVKKDMKVGCDKIAQEMDSTVENISNELKKPIK